MPVDFYGFAYAATVAAGGFFGYYKAGSVPSLSAGLIFGSALAIGAMQASQNPPQYQVQLGASALLAGMMGYRFYNSGKVMPAGIICALSLLSIARIGLKYAGVIGVSDKPH